MTPIVLPIERFFNLRSDTKIDSPYVSRIPKQLGAVRASPEKNETRLGQRLIITEDFATTWCSKADEALEVNALAQELNGTVS